MKNMGMKVLYIIDKWLEYVSMRVKWIERFMFGLGRDYRIFFLLNNLFLLNDLLDNWK